MREPILISAVPFASTDSSPMDTVLSAGIPFAMNPHSRTLSEAEMLELVVGRRVIIAGTEPITAAVMDQAPELELISRVGIGLDSVDLRAARERGVKVSYTPDEPAPAVAELTIGLILCLLRDINKRDRGFRRGEWDRPLGRRIAECTIGVVGVGRIGKRVIKLLENFAPKIIANDLKPDIEFGKKHTVEWCSKEELYSRSDVITIHTPLTNTTRNLIESSEFCSMQAGTVLVNTARGGIVNERALFDALAQSSIHAAAIDVFDVEPYRGPLVDLENCILTCHQGSCTEDCHTLMELHAAEEAVRFLKGQPLLGLVPEELYT